MQSRQKLVTPLLATLVVTALCALAVSGDQGKDDPPPVSHQIETFSVIVLPVGEGGGSGIR